MLLDTGRGFLQELGRRNCERELPGLFQPGSGRVWEDLGHRDLGKGEEMRIGNLAVNGQGIPALGPTDHSLPHSQPIPSPFPAPFPAHSLPHSLKGSLAKTLDFGFQGILPLLSPSRAVSISAGSSRAVLGAGGTGKAREREMGWISPRFYWEALPCLAAAHSSHPAGMDSFPFSGNDLEEAGA